MINILIYTTKKLKIYSYYWKIYNINLKISNDENIKKGCKILYLVIKTYI